MLISHIYPDAKSVGARSAGNLHAACDVVGAGNVLLKVARQFSTLPVAESFFATLKRECIGKRVFTDLTEAKVVLFDYIDVFYNR